MPRLAERFLLRERLVVLRQQLVVLRQFVLVREQLVVLREQFVVRQFLLRRVAATAAPGVAPAVRGRGGRRTPSPSTNGRARHRTGMRKRSVLLTLCLAAHL
ncbi:hypothetical protein ACH4F6_14400 [Streptomyces sp. NPDC017936]|uniref:hypothetical protein n=1 Tax=Streptomyces sp. NPDC017936 TaxID=3365016 RepID=UPI003792C07D